MAAALPWAKSALRAGPPEGVQRRGAAGLVRDLTDTVAALDDTGLAAPQIRVPLRIVLFAITRNRRS